MNLREKIILILAVTVVLFLVGYIVGYSAHERDTTPEEQTTITTNTIVRDTTIYNFHHRDSTIIDYHTKPLEIFTTITQHDTTYIFVPIKSYHFGIDGIGDIYVSGFDVTLDSTHFQLKEIHTVERHTVKAASRPNLIGVELGINEASLMYIRDIGRVSVGFRAGYTFDSKATASGFVGWNF